MAAALGQWAQCRHIQSAAVQARSRSQLVRVRPCAATQGGSGSKDSLQRAPSDGLPNMASSSDAPQDDAAEPLLPTYTVSSDSEPDEAVQEQPSLWTTLTLYKVTNCTCICSC
jgi:hypothetical protein